MMQRLRSAAIAIVLLFVIMFSGKAVIACCAVILSLMCLYEIFGVFSYQKEPLFVVLGIISSALMPFLDKFDTKFTAPIFFFYVLLLSSYMVFFNKRVTINDVAMVFFIIIIIPFCFSHIIFLRNLDFGKYYIWLPFIGAFCTDTAAYFVGKIVGGKKLCENLSPKKTISGSIGGFFGAVFGFFVYHMILKFGFSINISLGVYYLIAVLSGGISQIGDLTASAIKRVGHTKDFGNIMPGHGGIMDRVDSLVFVAPMIYFIISTLGIGVFY